MARITGRAQTAAGQQPPTPDTQRPDRHVRTAAKVPTTAVGADTRPAVGGPTAQLTFRPVPPGRVGLSDPVSFAASLAELILTVTTHSGAHPGEGSVWTVISDAAAVLIPGAEQAGIVVSAGLRRLSDLDVDVAHGDVQLLMETQDHAGEGPYLDAASSGEHVLVGDLHTDTRWPQFTASTPREIRSLLCTPLAVSSRAVGVLTVLSTRAWAFDDTSAQLATAVAAHAALALAHVERTRNLHAMAVGRDVIGQAKGILMQRHQLTADRASHTLVRASQNGNIELQKLCQHLARTGDFPTADSGDFPTARAEVDPAF